MATYESREAVNITSQFVPPEVDEAALAGLEMIGSRIVRPPRVAASPVHLECKFDSSAALPAPELDGVHHVVIGRVVGVHIRDDALTPEGKLDVVKIRPLARLGYHDYTSVNLVHHAAGRALCRGARRRPRRPADPRPQDRQRLIDRSNFIDPFHAKIRNCDQFAPGNSLPTKDAMRPVASQYTQQLEALKVLIVDDKSTMAHKVTRSLLQVIGVKTIYDANDGRSGLEAICRWAPDVVILDWSMPSPNGPEFVRQVRAPGRFPYPDVAIIMLTAHGERSRVVEAVRLGVNEFLLKPVSSTALLARLVSILAKPREMVKKGDNYIPAPRKMSSYKPETDSALADVVFI